MRSIQEEQLARIERAIDDLAGDARTPDRASRVAELWEMVAELDPELARRVPGYTGAVQQDTRPAQEVKQPESAHDSPPRHDSPPGHEAPPGHEDTQGRA